MPHALVNKVILAGQYVQLSGSNEISSDDEISEMDIYVVILQNDVAVRGRWTIPAGEKNWVVSTRMSKIMLQPGVVVTTGLAVFQTGEPAGFETYTWTQNLLATSVSQSAEQAA
jgi:hypothetical protein